MNTVFVAGGPAKWLPKEGDTRVPFTSGDVVHFVSYQDTKNGGGWVRVHSYRLEIFDAKAQCHHPEGRVVEGKKADDRE